jgi:UDP-N-acetylmuramoyl-L-alanyl-D-glutamate--2,6-diaminopimelate ligase
MPPLPLDEALRRVGHPAERAFADVALSGVTADSRAVRPGVLFAALPGARIDGRAFIADAVARGAAAVLAPEGTAWPAASPRVPLITSGEPRRLLARIAAELAGPAPATVVAVTGTNGKTSTVDFLRQIWTAAGARAASLGTLGTRAPAGIEVPPSALTTPDPVSLAETLAALRRAGVSHAAIEASSHGLDQHRLDGLVPKAAGFASFTRDHLDYHGTIERYREAKLRLFAVLLPAGAPVFAPGDLEPATLSALRGVAARRGLRLATIAEGGEIWRLRATHPTPDGQVLTVEHAGRAHRVELGLPGRFQADNVLLAAALAEATGVADPLAHLACLVGVPGRLERAARLPNGAAAYVDYAHTPDALARLLTALRPHARRLVCVFGAGGDRDAGKRPLMGEAVARLADAAIVTDDNPRSEDPRAIRAAILAGCPGAREIGDRREAIAAGLAELGAGDVLVVAGKGHETGQIVGGAVLPFDDAATIREFAG